MKFRLSHKPTGTSTELIQIPVYSVSLASSELVNNPLLIFNSEDAEYNEWSESSDSYNIVTETVTLARVDYLKLNKQIYSLEVYLQCYYLYTLLF